MCDPLSASIAISVRDHGPREAYRRLLRENDALILSPDLGNGRRIARERTAIHAALVSHWAEAERTAFGYDRPFAVAAIGGTGRHEMCPCSDTDLALLFDDVIEGNAFRERLQAQTIHGREFAERYGFRIHPQPFQIEDMSRLEGKQLNAFIDLDPMYDPDGLTARFRDRIRETFDPFEHFLEVSRYGQGRARSGASPASHERLDEFDIKIDGLRTFLAGIWTLAIEGFRHSHEVYAELDDPRDLEAYEFLLRMRAFIHLRRNTRLPERPDGTHPEDLLCFDDFISFDELLPPGASEQERREFSDGIRGRLLAARRRVMSFSRGVIGRELQRGRGRHPGHPIRLSPGGLHHRALHPNAAARDKSQAALSLLLAAQRYGLPINPSELEGAFQGAGDWLEPVPELAALFYESRGNLADSFGFLSQIEGAEERLFPGHDRFASSIDARVLAERGWCRAALARRKLETLNHHVEEGSARLAEASDPTKLLEPDQGLSVILEAAQLDADHLAAVKLALKTKRLPLTAEDLAAREDESLPFEERFASGFSGIPLQRYYQPLFSHGGFPEEAIRTAEFLVANRRAFKQLANNGFNDAVKVEAFAHLCGNEQRLRALFVFTSIDRADWENDVQHPSRWFNIRELYVKALQGFGPGPDRSSTLRKAGYGAEETAILEDFGEDFFSGMYRKHARRFGSHLVALAQDQGQGIAGPKAAIVRDGTVTILGVASRDFPGLAACITGEVWRSGYSLGQANLFSAMNQGLALDFFHLNLGGQASPEHLPHLVENAIQSQRHIGSGDEAALPPLSGACTIEETRPGHYRIRHETPDDTAGLVYSLTYKVYRHLGGNIHGLKSQVIRGTSFISLYLSLPARRTLEDARQLIATRF